MGREGDQIAERVKDPGQEEPRDQVIGSGVAAENVENPQKESAGRDGPLWLQRGRRPSEEAQAMGGLLAQRGEKERRHRLVGRRGVEGKAATEHPDRTFPRSARTTARAEAITRAR